MTEANNYYVSSRGLLKSCDYYSQTPQSSIKRLINYSHISNIANIKTPTIYICSSAIPHFINAMLPLINFPFILVSGDCDETIPDEILNIESLKNLLNDNRLIHWFSQNMIYKHEKVTIIPIGLDYHTMTSKLIWGPITSCLDQEKILQSILKNSKPFWERKNKCYANFHFNMETKYGYDRKDAFSTINKNIVNYEKNNVPRLITWNTQKDYCFVISPHGNGLDCHRGWEAMCLGCIPIVKTSKIDHLYKDLPVLIVQSWKDLNQKTLDNTITEFKLKYENKKLNYEKLSLKYWNNLINSYK